MTDPYQSPEADLGDQYGDVTYVGFWVRLLAFIVDNIVMLIIFVPVFYVMFGSEYFLDVNPNSHTLPEFVSYLVFAIVVIWMWSKSGATPGKMLVGAEIVDVKTNGPASIRKLTSRYFSYIVAMLPLCLGFLWIAFDDKKQGLHDKISGTAVIKRVNTTQAN